MNTIGWDTQALSIFFLKEEQNLKLYKRLIKIYLNPVPGFDVVSDEAIFMGSSSPGLSAKSQ